MKNLLKQVTHFSAVFCMSCTWLLGGAVVAPFGSFEKTLQGASDNWLSIPYRLHALDYGEVKSISESTVTVKGESRWTANELAQSGATPCYVLVRSGGLAGLQWSIESNTQDQIVLQGASQEVLNTLKEGDTFSIHPCWTLDKLFPNGQSIHPTLRLGDKQTVLLMPDEQTEGINLSAGEAFYYYAGNGPFGSAGWRKVGAPHADAGSTVIDRMTPFVIRHHNEASTELSIMGEIPLSAETKMLYAYDSGESDTMIAPPIPFDVSLIESGLYQTGAFAGSSSPDAIEDRLLVFEKNEIGYNLAPTSVYYYLEAASETYGSTGWRKVGEPYVSVDHLMLFEAGRAYVIRKSPSTQVAMWSGLNANQQ